MKLKCTVCREDLPLMEGFDANWWVEPHQCKVDSASTNVASAKLYLEEAVREIGVGEHSSAVNLVKAALGQLRT